MKKNIIVGLALLFLSFSVGAQNKTPATDKNVTPNTTPIPTKLDRPIDKVSVVVSKITFKETMHDFGNVVFNIPVTHVFEYTNKGKAAVAVKDVERSCGCTTPDWSKDPVAPGKKGKITATFNSATQGSFSKSITVKFVDGTVETLVVKGFVEANPEVPASPPVTPEN